VSASQETTSAASGLTQAVDILAFVEAQEIPAHYFETPYYLAPAPGGEQDYALLRETLRRTRKVGIAYVVIQARQHLAALVPQGQSLVLNTLRWDVEQREPRNRLGMVIPQVSAASEHAEAQAPAAPASGTGPFGRFGNAPLQQMRVSGCDDLEHSEEEEEELDVSLIDGEDLMRAFVRPRLHVPLPRAGRSRTTLRTAGPVRVRRVARRA